MAAVDELPRGWTFNSAPGFGGQAKIAIPPSTGGVANAITQIVASMIVVYTAPIYGASVLQAQWGGGPVYQLDMLLPIAGQDTGGYAAKDTFNWTGLLIGPPNTALTIEFANSAIYASQFLTVSGYPL